MSDRSLPGIQPIEEPKRSSLVWWWFAGGLLAVLAVIVAISIARGGGEDDYDSNTSYEAIAQCEAAIEERLKAPATAEFDSTASGSGTWIVVGTVDSENGFGAMVRSSFQCSVIIDNEEDTARVRIDRFE